MVFILHAYESQRTADDFIGTLRRMLGSLAPCAHLERIVSLTLVDVTIASDLLARTCLICLTALAALVTFPLSRVGTTRARYYRSTLYLIAAKQAEERAQCCLDELSTSGAACRHERGRTSAIICVLLALVANGKAKERIE